MNFGPQNVTKASLECFNRIEYNLATRYDKAIQNFPIVRINQPIFRFFLRGIYCGKVELVCKLSHLDQSDNIAK